MAERYMSFTEVAEYLNVAKGALGNYKPPEPESISNVHEDGNTRRLRSGMLIALVKVITKDVSFNSI